MFLVAGVGFVLARFLRIRAVQLSTITFNALAPCLVFELLATASVGGADVWRIVLFCVLMTATMGTIAGVGAMLLRLDRPTRAGFMLVVMFSNNANYGLPLVLFAFGEDALVFATVYFVTSAVLTLYRWCPGCGQRSPNAGTDPRTSHQGDNDLWRRRRRPAYGAFGTRSGVCDATGVPSQRCGGAHDASGARHATRPV